MVAADGRPKQVLRAGEQKSLITDRVILIPGPVEELKAIRMIFEIAAEGKAGSLIARELNRRGVSHDGRPWLRNHVDAILRNPKYMGCNTWGRRSQRLRGPLTWVERQHWITKPLVIVTHLPRRTRSVLLIDRSFMVSILLCIPKRHHGKPGLKIEPIVTESEFVTLLCITNNRHDRLLDMFVVPQMTSFTRTCPDDSWIRKGIRLRRLSDFYATVKKCWAERCEQEMIIARGRSTPKIANYLCEGEFVKTG